MKHETFAQARERILTDLETRGWTVRTRGTAGKLKVPHATNGQLRLWFKAQAVYASFGGVPWRLSDARSLDSDYRGIDVDRLIGWADRAFDIATERAIAILETRGSC